MSAHTITDGNTRLHLRQASNTQQGGDQFLKLWPSIPNMPPVSFTSNITLICVTMFGPAHWELLMPPLPLRLLSLRHSRARGRAVTVLQDEGILTWVGPQTNLGCWVTPWEKGYTFGASW